jgi:hypothetical protein
MAKCCAPVIGNSTRYRADRTTDARCHREAHMGIQTVFGHRSFCYQHFNIWAPHQKIVDRIRAIRSRPLESNPSTTRRTP